MTAPNASNRHRKGKSKLKDERSTKILHSSQMGKKNSPGNGPYYYAHAAVVVCLAIIISAGHRTYLSTLHENDKHFSHLSTLERELSFRTEMGLYFSYFKTIIDADTIPSGLHQIMRDNITEYPSTINTLKRFNLYPEVILGVSYRVYQGLSDYFERPTKVCWKVNRGEGMSPVQSCEGLGEPSYFYTEAIFALNGLMLGLFFLFGTYLSESIMGGVVTSASYMFNHGECTRVMWASPLRESFGYPFFVLQMFLVTIIIRTKSTSLKGSFFIAAAQIAFMLSWQFAQFALLTQTLSVLAVYVLQLIPRSTFVTILIGQSVGLLVSYVMLFGNEMLLTSYFACCLLAAWVMVALHTTLRRLKPQFLVMIVQVLLFFVVVFISKTLLAKIFQLDDDAHIGEIFKSKFSDFQNFHTQLYTCAKEFDFIETETLWKLLKTLLIPTSAFVFLVIVVRLLHSEFLGWFSYSNSDSKEEHKKDSGEVTNDGGEYVYHIFQLLACVAMAILIMRLKLFGTPQLCVISSLIAFRKLFSWGRPELHYAVVAVVVASMAVVGSANINYELSISGEFSNYPQEELVEWINQRTPKDAVFAGAMPTMATVKLCTHRPIVNHPHYEDAGLRRRTQMVYTVYSRKPLEDVKSNLDSLGVQYLILEDSWCKKRTRPGCSMPEIWDIEDQANRGKQPACTKLQNNPGPLFKLVFENSVYKVFKL